MKTINLIKRIIVSPFVLGILLITHGFFVAKRTIEFIRFGGEYVKYDKEETKTIRNLYDLIKERENKMPDSNKEIIIQTTCLSDEYNDCQHFLNQRYGCKDCDNVFKLIE